MQIYFYLLLPTLNVPLQIGKCTPGGTCAPGWEPLLYVYEQRCSLSAMCMRKDA